MGANQLHRFRRKSPRSRGKNRAVLRLFNGIKLAPHGGKCQAVAAIRLLHQLRRKGIVRWQVAPTRSQCQNARDRTENGERRTVAHRISTDVV